MEMSVGSFIFEKDTNKSKEPHRGAAGSSMAPPAAIHTLV
jgi:hypothetical protein